MRGSTVEFVCTAPGVGLSPVFSLRSLATNLPQLQFDFTHQVKMIVVLTEQPGIRIARVETSRLREALPAPQIPNGGSLGWW